MLQRWSLTGLRALRVLADKLDLSGDICATVEAALTMHAHRIEDSAAAELLLWAHTAQFGELKARLVQHIIKRGKAVPLEAVFGDSPLVDMVQQLQASVARLRDCVLKTKGK